MTDEALAAWLQANAHFPALTLAQACGMSERTIQRKLQLLKLSAVDARHALGLPTHWKPGCNDLPTPCLLDAPPDEGERVQVQHTDKGLTANLIVQTKQGVTLDLADAMANPKFRAALETSAIDLDDFEVVRFKANSWDVTLKLPTGPETMTNHQFLVEWKRKAPCILALAMEKMLARVEPAPAHTVTPMPAERMVEISLYDLHFGLLAWRAETGEDYDCDIAAQIVANTTAQLVARTAPLQPEYYLVPIGNDLFHVNDSTNTTPRSGNRLDVDTRLAHIIDVAEKSIEGMVEALADVAPVKLIWIPGNHDPQTSYWLLRVLAARYGDDERVDVDTSPMPRKYHAYGENLVGFAHGCDMSAAQQKGLPGIMADEAAHLWKPGQYREFHIGHTHKISEMNFVGAETYGSVVVRTIPSLCGTDYWHFSKGFVETSKTAQYFVWNKTYGPESVSNIHVGRQFYCKRSVGQ